jgi:hypothetical protein
VEAVSWGIGTVGCRVEVHVRGRMNAQTIDYWDGNWLASDIIVEVGAFHGQIAAALRVDEIQRFRHGLEVMYRTVSGTARLDSMEGWINLEVKIDGSGHVTVEGEVQDRPGVGNRLLFEIRELDQTDLPPLIEDLTAIEAAYPMLDQPL